MTSNTKFLCIYNLADEYSPAEITTAIEDHGIFCKDMVGRIKPAPIDDNINHRSVNYAKRWLELKYNHDNFPDPDSHHWDDYYSTAEDHPVYYLGWPEDNCPLKGSSQAQTNKYDLTKDWRDLARHIAENKYQSNISIGGMKGKLDDYASFVFDEFTKHLIKASHGRVPNANYIKRNALQGKQWWNGGKK